MHTSSQQEPHLAEVLGLVYSGDFCKTLTQPIPVSSKTNPKAEAIIHSGSIPGVTHSRRKTIIAQEYLHPRNREVKHIKARALQTPRAVKKGQDVLQVLDD